MTDRITSEDGLSGEGTGANTPAYNCSFTEWLKLVSYFEHERLQDEITEETYEDMMDTLMALRPVEKAKEE